MPKRRDYADSLREALLALALVPIAGLHTATYWLTESLERTSRLATGVIATTALGRSALPPHAPSTMNGAVADVLAQDLLDAVRLYVRSMVRLPADSAIYFTEEMERRLSALLEKIQPDATTDLESYVDRELEGVLDELDRLSLVARAAAGRRRGRQAARQKTLVDKLDDLRTRTRHLQGELTPQRRDTISLLGPPQNLRALNLYKTRIQLENALREAETLLPDDRKTVATIRTAIDRVLPQPRP